MVRRLIWVEDLLCSNHNNPKNIIIIILVLIYISNVNDIEIIVLYYLKSSISKYIKKLLRIPCYILKRV